MAAAQRPPAPPLELPASTMAMLRAAPRRLGFPGSTVDAEAAVFTLGPILAMPVIGLWLAHRVQPDPPRR